MPRARAHLIAVLVVALLVGSSAAIAQAPASAAAQGPARGSADTQITAEPSDETATLVFFNRPIVSFKARVLGRHPGERVASAVRALDDLVDREITGPVTLEPFGGGIMVRVASQGVFGLTSYDVDLLSGETVDSVSAGVVTRLQQALNEAAEGHKPAVILRSFGLAALGLAIGVLVLWGLVRARRAVGSRLVAASERTVAKSTYADIGVLRASRLLEIQQAFTTSFFGVLGLVVTYIVVTFVLRRFPFTRPWGESMRGFLIGTVETLSLSVAHSLPGLFTVLLIALLARFMIRLVRLWFEAVEQGRVRARWIYPETAQPTRRIVSTLVWLVAIVMAYPYLPGSDTEAFKGVSVFIGLMVTIGSSGLVNQIMSGFMITYSRALRAGDFVRIGDVEGTVTHLGVLSTKIKTVWQEEVTVPNAVVIGQNITDYTRPGDTVGVFTPTSVTIGYDTPWRQVHALLLQAAERTEGIRREPPPYVVQASLEDFYVKYTLLICLERQESRPLTFDALHANIQDLFNEYGVQIMSPNYVVDPAAPKVVERKNWFAAPAARDAKTPKVPV